jgi:hypothetical protein
VIHSDGSEDPVAQRNPLDVVVLQLSHMKAIAAERPEEGHLRMRSHPRLQELSDFPHHGCWNQERAVRLSQEL